MSNLAQQLGHTTKQVINGKEWTLTRSTWDMQAAWGTWLAERAERAAMKMAESYRKQAEPLWAELAELTRRADRSKIPLSPEERAEINARAKVISRQANTLEESARNTIERFQDRHAAGDFEFYSTTVGQMAQANLPGQFYLIWLCLQPNHPGVTLQEVIKAHMPDEGVSNFVGEWRSFLLKSEGVIEKNEPAESASAGSTPNTTDSTNPTPEPR